MKSIARLLFVALLGVLSTCCGGTMSFRVQEPAAEFVERLQDDTAALVWYLDDEHNETSKELGDKHTFCAGVYISAHEILTAYHCIDHVVDDGRMAVLVNTHNDDADIPASVKDYDKEHDLALLVVAPSHSYRQMAKLSFTGEELHIIGMPGGTQWAYQHGWISHFDARKSPNSTNPVPMMQVQAPIYYGNSGGPAFNNRGEVVGICSMRSTRIPDVGFFVPISVIAPFLASARR